MCDACARALGFRRPIPDGFYNDDALRAALANYDFGTVFAAVRQHTGLSQLRLGNLLGISQSRISSVERGERRLTHVMLAARIATALRIPPSLLGFPDTRTNAIGSVAAEEVDWVERRDFLALVTAATVGSSLHPELDRLGMFLPEQAEPATRRRIGVADIDAIEAITDSFRRSEYAHGGGLCYTAAVAHLHQVRLLDDSLCSSEVRARLLVATAELASRAGWMAYDIDDHDSARRLWTYALDTAHRAEDHPRAPDFAVSVLLDMAHQALHLKRPGEALQLVRLASATANNRRHPVSTITQGYIFVVLGWCRAALGETEATRRAIGQSQETYATANQAAIPPWAWFVTDAEIAAQQGHSLYLLSLTRPAVAPDAIELLAPATAGYESAYQRSRAMNLPSLAAVQFQVGDLDTAVSTGYDAVDTISELSSTRGYARLRVLDTVATQFTGKPEVSDLREHIRTALTTTAA